MAEPVDMAVIVSASAVSSMNIAASFLLSDPFTGTKDESGKRATFAFRLFFLLNPLMFMIPILADLLDWEQIPNVHTVLVPLINTSLAAGFVLRCRVCLKIRWLLLLAAVAFAAGALLPEHEGSIFIVHSGVASFISLIAVVRRKPVRNGADLALAVVLALWILMMIAHFSPVVLLPHFRYYIDNFVVFVPAHITGIAIFLVASHFLDAKVELRRLADTDPLTGLYNRRFFMERAGPLLSMAERDGKTGSLIMCDLDKFKRVNDTHGHEAGDMVIVTFAKTMASQVREYDVVSRFGGEEFLVLLPNTSPQEAADVAERIRLSTEAARVDTARGPISFTASFGVSQCEKKSDLERAIACADAALYASKESGRNRVSVATALQAC